MQRRLLSAKLIADTPADGRERVVFDSDIAGYALRVTAAGRRYLLLAYRSPVERQPRDSRGRGRSRRLTIGEVGQPVTMANGSTVTLNAFTGRKLAQVLRGEVAAGRDPFLERRARQAEQVEAIEEARAAALGARVVREVAADFIADAISRDRSPKTVREWGRLLQKHVIPVIGGHPIAEVGRAEAERVRLALPAGRRIQANRVQQVCCSLLNFASEVRGTLPNPFAAGRRGANRWHREELTRSPITREELGRLFVAIEEEVQLERGDAIDALRLIAFTGWRKSEVLTLRWGAIDFSLGAVTLGQTKTGRSERALSPEALALLNAIPSRGEFVFPSPARADHPRTEIKRLWLRVRARAGVEKPLHALRHAAATIALSEGVPLATVGALLGHRDPTTTLRYARIEQEVARSAAAVLGRAITSATAPRTDVLPISGKRRDAQ